MKLFGQYLVEKGMISEDELCSVLIEQMRGIPTVCEIVHETKLLSVSDILKILAHQSEERQGFIPAAKALSLWNDSLQKAVDEALIAKRIPLGQLLVESGKLEFPSLVKALDEYLAEVGGTELPTASATLPPQDETTAAGFNEFLSHDKIAMIDGLFNLLKEAGKSADPLSASREVLTSLHKGMREIHGAARLFKMTVIAKLASEVEAVLDVLLAGSPEAVPPPMLEFMGELANSAFKLIVQSKDGQANTDEVTKCFADLEQFKTLIPAPLPVAA